MGHCFTYFWRFRCTVDPKNSLKSQSFTTPLRFIVTQQVSVVMLQLLVLRTRLQPIVDMKPKKRAHRNGLGLKYLHITHPDKKSQAP